MGMSEIGKCDHRKPIGHYFFSRADWFGIEIHGITPYIVYGQRGIGEESMFWRSDEDCIWAMETWTQPSICTRVYSSLDKEEPAQIILQHWDEAEDKPRYWYTVILLSLKTGIVVLEYEEANAWIKKNCPGINNIPKD